MENDTFLSIKETEERREGRGEDEGTIDRVGEALGLDRLNEVYDFLEMIGDASDARWRKHSEAKQIH